MGGEGGLVSLVVLLAVFGGIFYFLLIRPQRKKQQEHEDLIDKLEKGDRVVSAGGIHGSIVSIEEETFLIDIGNGIELQIEKDSIVDQETEQEESSEGSKE